MAMTKQLWGLTSFCLGLQALALGPAGGALERFPPQTLSLHLSQILVVRTVRKMARLRLYESDIQTGILVILVLFHGVCLHVVFLRPGSSTRNPTWTTLTFQSLTFSSKRS